MFISYFCNDIVDFLLSPSKEFGHDLDGFYFCIHSPLFPIFGIMSRIYKDHSKSVTASCDLLPPCENITFSFSNYAKNQRIAIRLIKHLQQ